MLRTTNHPRTSTIYESMSGESSALRTQDNCGDIELALPTCFIRGCSDGLDIGPWRVEDLIVSALKRCQGFDGAIEEGFFLYH